MQVIQYNTRGETVKCEAQVSPYFESCVHFYLVSCKKGRKITLLGSDFSGGRVAYASKNLLSMFIFSKSATVYQLVSIELTTFKSNTTKILKSLITAKAGPHKCVC